MIPNASRCRHVSPLGWRCIRLKGHAGGHHKEHCRPAPVKPVSVGMTGTWGSTGPRVLRKGTNKQGQAVSYMALYNARCQGWAVVIWDASDVPTCEPIHSLLFKHVGARKFKPEAIIP